MLGRLTTLDLTGNNVRELDPEVLKDVPNLQTLRCASCGIMLVKSLVYIMLKKLEVPRVMADVFVYV